MNYLLVMSQSRLAGPQFDRVSLSIPTVFVVEILQASSSEYIVYQVNVASSKTYVIAKLN